MGLAADQLAERIRAERRAKVARRDAARRAMLGHTAAEVAERVLGCERPVRA